MNRFEHRACFGGWQDVCRHRSETLNCDMNVGVYLPPQAATQACPVLYWLSGLTCTEQNAITKAGMQRYAAEHGLIVVTPDTSPRGAGVADADGYDLGLGAGFYVDATQAPWAAHYRMHDYIARELPRAGGRAAQGPPRPGAAEAGAGAAGAGKAGGAPGAAAQVRDPARG